MDPKDILPPNFEIPTLKYCLEGLDFVTFYFEFHFKI